MKLLALFLLLSLPVHAQVARLEPAEPRWGQTLQATYDAGAPGAKLSADDEIYATVRLAYPGREDVRWARMTRQGRLFRCELKLDENLSAASVHFITLNGGWDEAAYITTAVYRPDGRPARGVLEARIKSGKVREFFEKEIALYPDNYSAYRTKWATAALLNANEAAAMIKADLNRLSKAGPENAELLAALATGNLMLGREEKGRELVRQAADRFPDDVFTGEAIREYRRWSIELGLPASGLADVQAIERKLIARNPRLAYARAASTGLAEAKEPPLDLIAAVSRDWSAAEPENPQPWFNLALALQNQYQQPERAAQAVEKAIELLRAGSLRLFGDVNSRQTERLLYASYLIKAEIASRLNKNDLALAALATAKQLAPEKDPKAFLLEARILRAAKQSERAEAAFLEAWRRGSIEAEERLKEMYKERRGGLQGYDEYVLSRGKGDRNYSEDWNLPAPPFRATTLDGHAYDWKSLQGRIVVLNMWFIGCGPCRKEIPRLNEVVREFKGRDVVFLAPSSDHADELRAFLKSTPFEYQVVPGAESLMDLFNIATYPTHIVIDRNGQIVALMTGAAERRPEEIRRVLLRMLQ